jgi:hypothetical protein
VLLAHTIEALHVVLQPTTRGIERIADRDEQILVPVVLARFAVHHNLSTRNREIHPNLVDIPLSMMPMGRLQGDAAGTDPIGELLQLFYFVPHLRLG